MAPTGSARPRLGGDIKCETTSLAPIVHRSPQPWSTTCRTRPSPHGNALFVLCQGHLEYETLRMLRERRHDVRRFLFGRGGLPYPSLPEGYLTELAAHRLERFVSQAIRGQEDPRDLWARFSYEEAAGGVQNAWAASSATVYPNCLGGTL